MSQPSNGIVHRSGFVTGLAWTFIGLAGFATLIAILQNIMLSLVFPLDEMREAMREAEKAQPTPAFARFMLNNFRLFFASFLALCVVTLVSAIGLLKRKNWARLAFIGVMALGVLWNLAGMVLPFFIFSSMPPVADDTPPEFRASFDLMMNIMTAFTVVIGLAFAGLFAWIIKKLVSDEIRHEFLAS